MLPSIQYVEQTSVVNNGESWVATIECPEGYLPIGWGFDVGTPGAIVYGALPVPGTRRWEVVIDGNEQPDDFVANSVCLAASDDTPEVEVAKQSRGRKQRRDKQRQGNQRERKR